MADIYSAAKRSEVMSRIRGTGNKDTEQTLADIFREHRIVGWRRKQPVFGKPDFVFPKLKLAVFVDGCFWHGCPKHATQPKNNAEFWRKKLSTNKARDLIVNRTLRQSGWKVMRIWEHDLTQNKRGRLLNRLQRQLLGVMAGKSVTNRNKDNR